MGRTLFEGFEMSDGTRASTAEIEATLNRPSISPDELLGLEIIPLTRNGLYRALARGEIENFKIGRKFIIPTAPLRRKLGMQAA